MTFRKLLAFFAFLALFLPTHVSAQNSGFVVIRDAEIEDTLNNWSTPLYRAAGISEDALNLILIQSSELNAFVAGGSNIFLFTGLITAAKSPGEVLGVISHELGHIAGGHLIHGRKARERATYESILAQILGIGAAVGGSSDAANALIIGGSGFALGSYLKHSRTQESSADQAALKYMEAAQYNPNGLASFLNVLKDQQLLPESQQNAYVRTHPLTSERLAAMNNGIKESKYTSAQYPDQWYRDFAMIKAKLIAYIEPQRVAWIYGEKDVSAPALYARAIAAYRLSKKDEALTLINRLITQDPQNPYFYELKGQMLRDFGRLEDAAAAYKMSLAKKPKLALARIDLAQVLIALAGRGNKQLYNEAEKQLDLARHKEKRSSTLHRLYATLYGRQGNEPAARYHLAEQAALQGRMDEARTLLDHALSGLKPGTKKHREALDFKAWIDAQPKDKNKKG